MQRTTPHSQISNFSTPGETKKQMVAWTRWSGKYKTLWEMVSGGTQERQNHAVGQWEGKGIEQPLASASEWVTGKTPRDLLFQERVNLTYLVSKSAFVRSRTCPDMGRCTQES